MRCSQQPAMVELKSEALCGQEVTMKLFRYLQTLALAVMALVGLSAVAYADSFRLRIRFSLKRMAIHCLGYSRAPEVHQQQIVPIHEPTEQLDVTVTGSGGRISGATLSSDNPFQGWRI